MIDRASVLSADTRARLERELAAFERETGHQIVVHTTPTLEGLEIEEYSIAVAEQWKIGHKGLDNGVILTVAPAERDVRIEVGYGLEGVLPDAIAFRILQEYILPEFRARNMEGGILAGTDAIMRTARGEVLPVPEAARRTERRRGGPPVWIWLIIFALAFGTRGFFFWPFLGSILAGAGRMSGGTRAGGFGGGGFSGGGGGFGGGGASGKW